MSIDYNTGNMSRDPKGTYSIHIQLHQRTRNKINHSSRRLILLSLDHKSKSWKSHETHSQPRATYRYHKFVQKNLCLSGTPELIMDRCQARQSLSWTGAAARQSLSWTGADARQSLSWTGAAVDHAQHLNGMTFAVHLIKRERRGSCLDQI